MIDKTRLLAHKALMRVFSGGYSNIVLTETIKGASLNETERGFLTRLFYGVLERKITLEFILGKFLKSNPPENVKTALLMGLYQYLYLDSVPEFALVNSSCELIGNPKMKGLVNAVLRNAIREGKENLLASAEEKPNLKYSVSEALYREIKASIENETEDYLLSSFNPPPLFIKVNSRLVAPETLIESLNKKGIKAEKTIIPDGLKLEFSGDIVNLEEYKKGLLFTEDLSSQLAVAALGVGENDLVLDLCAAPGGKSFSASLKAKEVHSFDIYPQKIESLNQNAKRLSLPVIGAVQSAETAAGREDKYDKVICDVPCSGSGVLRRKPEIRFKGETDKSLIALQRKIMLTAAASVKRGGRILYSTCSVNKKENDENLNWLLSENKNLKLIDKKLILPKDYNSDGFYYAVIERCL